MYKIHTFGCACVSETGVRTAARPWCSSEGTDLRKVAGKWKKIRPKHRDTMFAATAAVTRQLHIHSGAVNKSFIPTDCVRGGIIKI